jgi:hypothetical protein
MILGGFEPEPIIVPDNMEDCHMEIINHRKEKEDLVKKYEEMAKEKAEMAEKIKAMEQAMMNVATSSVPDPNIAGTSHGVGTLQHATDRKKRKNADISMEMYDSLNAEAQTRIDGLKALIDRDGLDITTSRALKDHIMVNPEFVDDEFHYDVPTIKPVEDPEMYTYRWNLSFKHVRPSKTVMDPLSTSSNKKCIDMFMGFEDVPCEVASMIIRVMDPPTEDLPTILQVRRKGSLWFTYVLDDLDANIQKLANVNNINTKRVGLISDIGKWVFEKVPGIALYDPRKTSFCLIFTSIFLLSLDK